MEQAGPIRVVIVDDTPRTVENLKKLLGFEPDIEVVGSALTAQAGMEEVRRKLPDLLLMDVNLPDLDGIQATRLLTTELPNLSVILISVQEDREYLKRAMQAGAREYLIKPFSADDLVNALRRVYARDSSRARSAAEAAASVPSAPQVLETEPAPMPTPVRMPSRSSTRTPVSQPIAPPLPAPSGPPSESLEPRSRPLAATPVAAPPAPAPGLTPTPTSAPREAGKGEGGSDAALGPLTTFHPIAGEPPAMKTKSQTGEVTCIFSGKGGVGKSMIAVNLATLLAKELQEDIALVDLDLQFGDLAVLLGLEPPGSLADLAKAYPDIDASTLGGFMPQAPGGVRVLAAPLSPELADLVRPEHIRLALHLLKGAFDHVIVDMSPHLNDVSLEALETADRVLVITDLNIPAIKDAKLAFNLFEHLGISRDRIHLVLNRSDAPANVTIAQLEANLRCPVSVSIPSEGKLVLQSLQKGVPFVLLFPEAEISLKMRDLVGCLVPLAGAKKGGARKAGRRKFWARSGAS